MAAAPLQGVEGVGPVAQAGVALGLLQRELHEGAALRRDLLAGPGALDHRLEAALDQREPGRHLQRPGLQVGVAGLAAHLARGLAGGLGVFRLAEVVVDAAEQRGQPSGLHHQLAVLGQAQPLAQQLDDLAEAPAGALAEHRAGGRRVGPAQQVDRLGDALDRARAEVGRGGQPGQLERVDGHRLAAQHHLARGGGLGGEQVGLGQVEGAAVERAVPVVDLPLALLPVADHPDEAVAAGEVGGGVARRRQQPHGHLLLGPQASAALGPHAFRPGRHPFTFRRHPVPLLGTPPGGVAVSSPVRPRHVAS